MRRDRHALFTLFSIVSLLLSTMAGRGFPLPVDRLLAAPREPATPAVTVAPAAGTATDTFTFSLTGFAAGESVTVRFTVPPWFTAGDFPPPDVMTTTVDSDGGGSVVLRPVDQGVILPGTWVVTFTGQASGATQTASFTLSLPPDCGC